MPENLSKSIPSRLEISRPWYKFLNLCFDVDTGFQVSLQNKRPDFQGFQADV